MGDLQRHYSDLLPGLLWAEFVQTNSKENIKSTGGRWVPPEKASNAKCFSVHRVLTVKYYNFPLMIYSHKIRCLTQCTVLCKHMNMMNSAETRISPDLYHSISTLGGAWQHRLNTESDILWEKLWFHWECWTLMPRFAEISERQSLQYKLWHSLHSDGKVVSVTALVVTGDVEACL